MIAAESMAPGSSPTEVARRHGIGTGQLYNWRRALVSAQPRTVGRFARVELTPHLASHADAGATSLSLVDGMTARTRGLIEIVLADGTTVRVDAHVDPRALRRVLTALRG
jgi:transposase